MTDRQSDILGVVGGLGPLASAAFLQTIYEYGLGAREQQSPVVVMYSDPTFPDRTQTLLNGDHEDLLRRLGQALRRLKGMGARRLVVCCVTMHHLLPRLEPELRGQVLSLLDVTLEEVARGRKRHLLFCTSGTRRLEVFQQHPGWRSAEEYVLWPDECDQASVHELIYRVKSGEAPARLVPTLERLLGKYGVDSFIAGCTEIHILAKHFNARGPRPRRYGCVDALDIIARRLAGTGL